MKTGRPKNVENTKIKTISLSLRANIIYSKIRKQNKYFDFSKYISRCLIRDFDTTEGHKDYLKQLIGTKHIEITELVNKIKEIEQY